MDDLKIARQQENRERRRQRVEALAAQRTPDMSFGGALFSIVLADPPWQYEAGSTDPTRQIENQYPTMTLDAIGALPVHKFLTTDAMLFLWAPAPKVEEALGVMRNWGFTYRTNAVWDKGSIGPGYYFRTQHELLLVGARGRPITPLPEARVSSVIKAPRREHSRKPDEVYVRLEAMYPELNKVELFARQLRSGWFVWGLETGKF